MDELAGHCRARRRTVDSVAGFGKQGEARAASVASELSAYDEHPPSRVWDFMSESIDTTMADSTRDWQRNRAMWVRILEKRTGVGVDTWKRRIRKEGLDDEASLRAWLTSQGVTGYG
ncbi:MAG TPA: hypothetical protein VFZ21_23100 [Gemmatimonadaceae bacterium]|nr:hypothetical protein [Gemmatimonadaceae bacterium]